MDTVTREGIDDAGHRIVEAALEAERLGGQIQLGTYHWLTALLLHAPDAVRARLPELDTDAVRESVAARLASGAIGIPLSANRVTSEAVAHAKTRGASCATVEDVAAVVLAASDLAPAPRESKRSTAREACEAPTDRPACRPGPAVAPRPTPHLDQFGRDLTALAREGRLPPVIGRREEIELVCETLCRRFKRNPALLGPAGVGKTAIAEGLAQEIADGKAPAPLQDVRVIELMPSALIAGGSMVGEIERRVLAVLEEAKDPGVVLFIDEMHAIMGGGGGGPHDLSTLFKPALARGDIACIAATTDDEYRRFIERDRALARRFQPVQVTEMSVEQALEVMRAFRDGLESERGILVSDGTLRRLVQIAEDLVPNRVLPDKAVDLLEQCGARAALTGRQDIDLALVESVAERMAGAPKGLLDRVEVLDERLAQTGLVSGSAAAELALRLELGYRGLAARASAPTGVLVVIEEEVGAGHAVASALSRELFDSEDRVVTLDFGQLTQPHDSTVLLGAPPGYIGYGESLPIHRIAHTPWCVVECRGVHRSHPKLREHLADWIEKGRIVDAAGKRISLRHAVFVLTVESDRDASGRIGFGATEGDANGRDGTSAEGGRDRMGAEPWLGTRLASLVDVVSRSTHAATDPDVPIELLDELARRYAQHGLELCWGEGVLETLRDRIETRNSARQADDILDRELGRLLLPHLPAPGSVPVRLRLTADGGVVEAHAARG